MKNYIIIDDMVMQLDDVTKAVNNLAQDSKVKKILFKKENLNSLKIAIEEVKKYMNDIGNQNNDQFIFLIDLLLDDVNSSVTKELISHLEDECRIAQEDIRIYSGFLNGHENDLEELKNENYRVTYFLGSSLKYSEEQEKIQDIL